MHSPACFMCGLPGRPPSWVYTTYGVGWQVSTLAVWRNTKALLFLLKLGNFVDGKLGHISNLLDVHSTR